jgi:hypothetical protein
MLKIRSEGDHMRLGVWLAPLLFTGATASYADVIPYPDTGTIAPTVLTYATASGGINVYFAGSGASFTDYVQVHDVQTGYNSGDILDNHTNALGSEVSVGTAAGQINAGDQLVFYIDSPEGLLASVPSYSADGVNHAYITIYSGGTIGSTLVPAGIYVGLEDEANGESDFNYFDDTFVFGGVSAPSIAATPEPCSLLLLGTGILGVAAAARRRLLSR